MRYQLELLVWTQSLEDSSQCISNTSLCDNGNKFEKEVDEGNKMWAVLSI